LALPEGSGEFIRSLPVAVLTTILASLFVSLTIIPFLASRILPRSAAGHSNVVLDRVMGLIHGVYRPALHLALERPRVTVAVSLAVFVLSLGLVPRLGFSLFPENDAPVFMVDVEMPQGTAISATFLPAVSSPTVMLPGLPSFITPKVASGNVSPTLIVMTFILRKIWGVRKRLVDF
jgi:multidrug efflux pump subunit AcrB